MQAAFRSVAHPLSRADIVTSGHAPFGSFAPAADLKDFYAGIAAHQEREGAVLLGGFVYGGVFADLHAGRKPKDFDIYIASPNMVRALSAFARGAFADDDYMNEDEWADMALGYGFPIKPLSGLNDPQGSDILGEFFSFVGRARIGGTWQPVDVKIGTHNVLMEEFLAQTPAPIMAAAMALDRDDAYAYHRDCVDHADRRILCTDRIHATHFIEKAKRKGLELITPAQLSAREGDMKASFTATRAAPQPVAF